MFTCIFLNRYNRIECSSFIHTAGIFLNSIILRHFLVKTFRWSLAGVLILAFFTVCFQSWLRASYTSMWLLGSPTEGMEEHLSPSARLVRSPGNPARVHSIEAILGFKEDNLFHHSVSYGSGKFEKDAERRGNEIISTLKKEHSAESFDSKWHCLAQGLCWNIGYTQLL